jgi:hypothetical protein
MPRTKKADTVPQQEQGNGAAPTKTGAVEQALDALGRKAKPRAIRNWILDNLHMDVTTSLISNIKSTLKKRGRRKVGRPRKEDAGAPAAPVAREPREGGISVDDVKAVKELTSRIGADQVKQLAEMLGK